MFVTRSPVGASRPAQAPTSTPRPPLVLTIEAATRTATAAYLAITPTITAMVATARAEGTERAAGTQTALAITPTAEPTLCPLPPIVLTVSCCGGVGPECTATIQAYRRAVCEGLGTQAAYARGTDTPTPTPSGTPTATDTPTTTPEPPTDAPTPLPTATRTTEPTPTARPVWRVYVPELIVRRPRR